MGFDSKRIAWGIKGTYWEVGGTRRLSLGKGRQTVVWWRGSGQDRLITAAAAAAAAATSTKGVLTPWVGRGHTPLGGCPIYPRWEGAQGLTDNWG